MLRKATQRRERPARIRRGIRHLADEHQPHVLLRRMRSERPHRLEAGPRIARNRRALLEPLEQRIDRLRCANRSEPSDAAKPLGDVIRIDELLGDRHA
jgi:hypothetical protein